jgi:hypothetical protein
MAEVVVLTLKLVFVIGIQKQTGATLVQFQGGQSGKLSPEAAHYDYYLRLAQRSLERKHPVGVAFDKSGDTISEVARADSDFVSNLVERDRERIEVHFQGHDGIFFLRRDHPEFPRISVALKTSMQANKRVWFVAKKPHLLLDDVILDDGGAVEK